MNDEILSTPEEAGVLIEQWRRHYNTLRPPSTLGNARNRNTIALIRDDLETLHHL